MTQLAWTSCIDTSLIQAYINLDERLKDPSMETFRRYGAQVSLDQLPLGVLVRPPNLRISYSIENGQVSRQAKRQEEGSMF